MTEGSNWAIIILGNSITKGKILKKDKVKHFVNIARLKVY